MNLGLRILLVEDEALIAMMLGDWIAELGHVVGGPHHHAASAVAYLDTENTIDAALLDVQLADGDSFPVADELVRRNLPFAFMTGLSGENIRRRYSDALVLTKPCDFESVRATIGALLDSRTAVTSS